MQHELIIIVLVVFNVFFFFFRTKLKASPPRAVIDVLATVMIPLSPCSRVSEDRSWKAARALMSKVRLSSRQSPLLD